MRSARSERRYTVHPRFKAVVAMDVGPPDMLAPRWANVPKILAVGLAYQCQYWWPATVMCAHESGIP